MPEARREVRWAVKILDEATGDAWLWVNRTYGYRREAFHQAVTSWHGWLRNEYGAKPEEAWTNRALRRHILDRFRRGLGPNCYTIRVVRVEVREVA